jgi:hypothetical protein
MKRKYRNYSNNDIVLGALKATSMAQLLTILNLRPTGGNYVNMRRLLQKLNIKCDHWGGSAWSKDKQLKDWSQYTKCIHLKPHLIKLRGNKCECCSLTKWLEKEIKLEIHHLNGDRTNNHLENLQLLCPNCHSFTDNFRNRKMVGVAGPAPAL